MYCYTCVVTHKKLNSLGPVYSGKYISPMITVTITTPISSDEIQIIINAAKEARKYTQCSIHTDVVEVKMSCKIALILTPHKVAYLIAAILQGRYLHAVN